MLAGNALALFCFLVFWLNSMEICRCAIPSRATNLWRLLAGVICWVFLSRSHTKKILAPAQSPNFLLCKAFSAKQTPTGHRLAIAVIGSQQKKTRECFDSLAESSVEDCVEDFIVVLPLHDPVDLGLKHSQATRVLICLVVSIVEIVLTKINNDSEGDGAPDGNRCLADPTVF